MGRPLFLPEGFHHRLHARGHNFERDPVKYQNESAIIVGVSADSAQSHEDFCAKEGLNFKLLVDPQLKTILDYGSVMERIRGTSRARPRIEQIVDLADPEKLDDYLMGFCGL